MTDDSSAALIKSQPVASHLWSTFPLRLWSPSRYKANNIHHENALIKSITFLFFFFSTGVVAPVNHRTPIEKVHNKHKSHRLPQTPCRSANATTQFPRLAAGNLMTPHIFSSSSHNKYSLFCTCLDGGRGEAGTEIRFKEQTSMTVLWNKPCPLLSEWQLVKPQRLAQPSPPLPPPSFSLICYSYVLSRLLFHSPLLFYYAPILSLLPLCATPQSAGHPLPHPHTFTFLFPLKQHASSALTVIWGNAKVNLYFSQVDSLALSSFQTAKRYKLISVMWNCQTVGKNFRVTAHSTWQTVKFEGQRNELEVSTSIQNSARREL